MKREGSYRDEPRSPYPLQCSWETYGQQCRLPVGVVIEDRGYCGWHDQAKSWVYDPVLRGKTTDPRTFEEWVNVVRSTYGCYNTTSPWSKYTIASLWAAVQGKTEDWVEDPQWVAENVIQMSNLSDDAVIDYRKLFGEISGGGLSPTDWRVKLAAVNDKHGVVMAIPPEYEEGKKTVAKPTVFRLDKPEQTPYEADQVRREQQERARQMGLDIDRPISEVPF